MLPIGFMLAAAFIAGAALSGSGFLLPVVIFAAGAVAIAAVVTEQRSVVMLGVVLLATVLLGSIRVEDDTYDVSHPDLDSASSFTARVHDVPRYYPSVTYSRVAFSDPVDGIAWAELPPYPEVQQGDVLSIEGRFNGFDEESFQGFAAQRGTEGVLYAERISVLENRASPAQRLRNNVSHQVRVRLRARIPEPAGAFATGIVLGDDGAMTEATRDAFRVGGLSHMTAVSGIHVGIIAGAVLLLSRFGLIHRWWLMGASIPLIWMFAYLVGMRPSVVRASLMLTLFLLAQFLGRPRDTLNAVGLAAALMILVDPGVRYDIGFQLSVAATAGIALGVLLIGNGSRWHIVWVVPLAAEIATFPLILYHFGYYSLASPLANIVAAPFLAVAMAMSLLTVLASYPSAVIADALAMGTWAPSIAVVRIADIAATFPGLTGEIEPLSTTGVWIAYTLLGGVAAILFVVLRPRAPEPDHELDTVYRV